MTARKSLPPEVRARLYGWTFTVLVICATVAAIYVPTERWEKLGRFLTDPATASALTLLGGALLALYMRARATPPVVLLLALTGALSLPGCGASQLEQQATGVTVALRIVDAAQGVYTEDLDHRMAGCTDDECITEARAHGQPVEAALDTALVAVRAWGAAIAVAADVDAGGDVPAVVLSALARVLSLWDELEAALRAYGVAVPPEVGHAIAFLAALAGAT